MAGETHLDGAGKPPAPGAPGAGGLVPVNQQIVTWDGEGNPIVKTQRVFTKAQVSEIAMAAASQPYVDPNDELAVALGLPPSRFYGMSNLEVMLIKQAEYAASSGERDYVNDVLDRLIGKPVAKSESHNINETYDQALQRIAKAAAAKAKPANIVDAEIVK